jgi:hypothetical protein
MAALLPPFPVLLVLVAAASLLATSFAPAGRSVVPSLVPPGELVRANSWMGMALTFQGTSDQPSAVSWSPVRASAGRCGAMP